MKAIGIAIALACFLPVTAYEAPPSQAFSAAVGTRAPASGLWRNPGDIRSLDLLHGSGGKEHAPAGKFTFVKEDTSGTNPKFEIVDQQGVRWKAKLGEEAQAETAASRLVWAAGYFTDDDYYLPEVRIANIPKLKRGRQYVTADGVVRGVRLERVVPGQKKDGNWSWFKNPFGATREMNGLKVMMALLNNWDLKEINNDIYREPGGETRYVIGDLGATLGRTGNPFTRSKSNLREYRGTKFIQKVRSEEVDFQVKSRPFFLTVFAVPNYVTRTKMQGIVKHIPRTHAKWLGQLLAQLSPEQIRDCFRAAGYTPEEVDGFAKVVQSRIADLNRL